MVSEDRGQVLLVGAVVLAVTLIAIVTLLNGVAYTEHVGGGDQDTHDDAKRVERSLKADLDGMSTSVLGDEDDEPGDVGSTANDMEHRYSTMLSTTSAASVDITYRMDESRTVIEHDSGPFQSDASGAPQVHWDLVTTGERSDISSIDTFSMEILTTGSSLPENAPFKIMIGGDTLLLQEHPDGGQNVKITGNMGSACSNKIGYSPGDTITIDFIAQEITVGSGSPDCTISQTIGSPARIRYEAGRTSGNRVYPYGQYEVVLSGAPDLHSRPEFDPEDGTNAWPEVKQTVVIDFTYATPSMTYSGTIESEEVAPDA